MYPLYNLLLTNFRICFTGYELNKFFNEVSGLLRSFFYVVGLKNVLSIYGTIHHRQLWYIMYPIAILLFWHYKFKCVPGNKLDGDINATPIFRGGKTDAGQKNSLKKIIQSKSYQLQAILFPLKHLKFSIFMLSIPQQNYVVSFSLFVYTLG